MPLLETLRQQVCRANLELVRLGLVIQTWGNLSGIDRARGLVVIKPSGVPYAELRPRHMVVVRLRDGKVVEGSCRPSSDTPTHLELYRAFGGIGAVAHTHSLWATIWAQAMRPIPPQGTTHADHFFGSVPCTRELKAAEIRKDYELNTGRVIVERFSRLDPLRTPAVLVARHGPFVWGASLADVVSHGAALEAIARLAAETLRLAPAIGPLPAVLLEKHYFRKHGPGATYGQPGEETRRSQIAQIRGLHRFGKER
jgi:L-ribulose-5-phosphate 4-epimerase